MGSAAVTSLPSLGSPFPHCTGYPCQGWGIQGKRGEELPHLKGAVALRTGYFIDPAAQRIQQPACRLYQEA